ncbi:MAG: phenylalanine--tRNA ligase subunit beta [Actinomycetota bacterium]
MRVPLSWLREFCPVKLSAEDLADLLTSRGLHLERLLRPWEALSGVVIAKVLEVRDHPNADKLCVASVESGSGTRDVVVGVRNMAAGDLVPYAAPGSTLPGFEGKLERRELRGVTSDGMLCSPSELGISADHGGILILQAGDPGEDLKDSLGLDDTVIDIEVVPNRPDLLSVYGVAREAAAATGDDLAPPDASVEEIEGPADAAATVEVHDSVRCPRYLARVIRGVTVGPSPISAQIRLTAAGMRPVSNVVDATNYAMLELGQPMHPFDLKLLAGPGIEVRTAAEGEKLTTLDGVERTMTKEDLLIADVERSTGIAGVMGAGNSEVSQATTDILLESAHFQPVSVLRTARRLGLRTEASIRFERGADPEAVPGAAARAAALIASWSGGQVLSGAIDVGSAPERRTVSVRPSRASILVGIELSSSDVREALGRLRLQATEEGEQVVVEVPGYRFDLEREVDLIEEVARTVGYERVPSTLPGVRQAGGLSREQRLRRRITDLLSGAGLLETRAISLGPESDAELVPDSRPIRVANPVSEDDASLRASLLPGLLRAARRNVSVGRTSIRVFESGRTFSAGDPDPVEEERVAILLTGPLGEGWPNEPRPQDFLEAKGVLEHLLSGLGVEWSAGEARTRPWHPGRSFQILVGGNVVGECGEIHPAVASAFDLPSVASGFELKVEQVLAAAPETLDYRDISRFPPVRRDVAFIVDRDAPAGLIQDGLIHGAGHLLERVLLFDVFEGDPVPEGKKSLAFALDLRAPDRTLTDEEADQVVRAIADRLASEFGAELRAG